MYANKPIAMLGIPESTSDKNRTTSGNQPRPKSAKNNPQSSPKGVAMAVATPTVMSAADDAVGDAAARFADRHRQLRKKRPG